VGVHDIITALVGYKHHESISTSQFLPRDAMQNVVLPSPSRLSVCDTEVLWSQVGILQK